MYAMNHHQNNNNFKLNDSFEKIKSTDSPVVNYRPSITKNFEVKCIRVDDLEACRKNPELLEEKGKRTLLIFEQ